MSKCSKCGKETELNFGRTSAIMCEKCAEANSKTRIKNSTASTLSVFSGIFIAFAAIGALIAFSIGHLVEGVYILFSGVILMLFFDGLSEIIKQLVQLNKNISEQQNN